MLAPEQQKMIADLKAKIADNERELSRATTFKESHVLLLRNLLDQIHALKINSGQKRSMTDICLHLLETDTIAKRLNIELTEADVRFIAILEKKHPNLNNRELRICLLIKLDYDSEEIARTAGMTTRGIESIRYRMHSKLGLGKHDSINNYLTNLAVS